MTASVKPTSLDLLVLVLIGQVVRVFLEDIEEFFSFMVVAEREEVSDLVVLLDQIQTFWDGWVVLRGGRKGDLHKH